MGSNPPVRSRLPTFSSLEEEATFGDTHDTTEFDDEWEPVELEVTRPLMHRLSVRLPGPVFTELVAIAKKRGISTSALASEWLQEAIDRAATNNTTQ
jgi:hypothetical protein